MSTSAHLTSFSSTGWALGDFRSSASPRLLRLARCHGYASFACGCGGILCPCLQRSPDGGSTLITFAPKSDRITAALGPAMKLARSTTFTPEKMLSVAIVASSAPLVLWGALLVEGLRAFLLVVRAGAQTEQRGFEGQALGLTRFEAFVHRLE